jgi:hypothetical protein
MMRVLITGSRSWTAYNAIQEALSELVGTHILVSGNCPQGADLMCEKAAQELGWEVELYPANWDLHGKKAGFIRNKEMVDSEPDICLGFIHNKSKGGSMTVRLAKTANIPTIVYAMDDFSNNGELKVSKHGFKEIEIEEDSLLF